MKLPTNAVTLDWRLKASDPTIDLEYAEMIGHENRGAPVRDVVLVMILLSVFHGIVMHLKGELCYPLNRFILSIFFLLPVLLLHTALDKSSSKRNTIFNRNYLYIAGTGLMEVLIDVLIINAPWLSQQIDLVTSPALLSSPVNTLVTFLPFIKGDAFRFVPEFALVRSLGCFMLLKPSAHFAIASIVVEMLLVLWFFDFGYEGWIRVDLYPPIAVVIYFAEYFRKSDFIRTTLSTRQVKNLLEVQEDLVKTASTANTKKEEFFSYIFHEVRVPMHAISMSVDLLQDNPRENAKEILKGVRKQVDQATQILNDVLSMQKLEDGKFSLHMVWFNMEEFLQSILGMFSTIAKSQDLTFTLENNNQLLPNRQFLGDPIRLQQVICNFVSNSIKFTEEGDHITLYVKKLSGDEDSAVLEIGVKDTGVGVPDSVAPLIFQPYTQAKSSSHMGTGLGLNIAKQLSLLHGGDADFESTPGKGSRFFCTIPFRTREYISPIPSPVLTPVSAKKKKDSGTVLIVEDSKTSRKLLTAIVQKLGHVALAVCDGVEATEVFNDPSMLTKVRCIFMDKHMPRMQGDEATTLIRKKGFRGTILALTGDAFESEKLALIAAGADDVIVKPAGIQVIKAALKRAFNN